MFSNAKIIAKAGVTVIANAEVIAHAEVIAKTRNSMHKSSNRKKHIKCDMLLSIRKKEPLS